MSNDKSAGYWSQIKGKGRHYWSHVLILGFIGFMIGHYLSEIDLPQIHYSRDLLYRLVSSLDEKPRPSSIGDILIVEITDEEYWKGELAGRKPIKRDYLARLIKAVCSARPKVAALDFDFRSPVTDGTLRDHTDYAVETENLAVTIMKESKENCKIVLPKTFRCSEGKCIEESSVLDGYAFDKSRVTSGYINFHKDIRRVPITQKYINGKEIVSFSFAVAAADSKHSVANISGRGDYPYGLFKTPDYFKNKGAVVSANRILESSPENIRDIIEHKTVIFGADWRRYAYKRGDMVDGHASPAGYIPGVYIHANYVVSILNGQTVRSVPYLGTAIEIILVCFVAFLFAVRMRFYQRLLLIFGGGLFVIFAAYFLWINLAIFIEPVIPIVMLILHWAYDENKCLRDKVSEYGAEIEKLKNLLTSSSMNTSREDLH